MGPPGLSFVENVEGVGEEFMKAVFALDVGEAGAAVNRPETIVYVVRIASDAPGSSERPSPIVPSPLISVESRLTNVSSPWTF